MMRLGYGLQHLFMLILKHCKPSRPNLLWHDFWESLCDDLPHHFQRLNIPPPPINHIFDYGLFLLTQVLINHGSSLACFPSMPLPQQKWEYLDNNPYISEQLVYNMVQEQTHTQENIASLNVDQLASFNVILDSTLQQDGKLFFLDSPGRTGKTYVYKTLCHHL